MKYVIKNSIIGRTFLCSKEMNDKINEIMEEEFRKKQSEPPLKKVKKYSQQKGSKYHN